MFNGAPHSRRGSGKISLLLAIGSLALLASAVYLLSLGSSSSGRRTGAGDDQGSATNQPLVLLCAASNKAAVERIVHQFAQETGCDVQVQYGPSQSLLSNILLSRTGDLYLPADESYLELAQQEQLTQERFALATMHAVLAVKKGNPLQIKTWDDLHQPDLRISFANLEAAAIGKLIKDSLETQNKWEAFSPRIESYKTTVNDVASDVKIGAADAGIVWDAVAAQFPELETVSLPELENVTGKVALSVLTTSQQPTLAIRFARYASADDRGLTTYRELGFDAAEGDPWEWEPEVTLYAGSMLRPAVEQTIQEFEQREGVRISRVYNGCGILVGMMQGGEVPDAYFACDQEFMNQVSEKFPQAVAVSSNQLVILVPKGNPHRLASLKDLSQPGLRVGIGHEKQCAMGWLTQKTLDAGGLKTEVMANVTVQTPTGDMLVNQLRAGSLDAAVAYLSNAAGAADFLDAVTIDGIPCAIATQPYGVSSESKHRQIMQRLLQQLQAEESKRRFILEGFRWQSEKAPAPDAGLSNE